MLYIAGEEGGEVGVSNGIQGQVEVVVAEQGNGVRRRRGVGASDRRDSYVPDGGISWGERPCGGYPRMHRGPLLHPPVYWVVEPYFVMVGDIAARQV